MRIYLTALVLVAAVVTLGGCGRDYYEDYAPAVEPGEITTVETLELEPAEEEIEDVNFAGQERVEMSIERARQLALENNLELKVQLIEPAIAAEQVDEQEARFEWAFFGNTSYYKTDTPTATTLSGSRVDSSITNLGVQMPLTTGGTLTFDLGDNRLKTNNIFSTLNPSYSTDAAFSISQPLLRNAGGRANTHFIRIAKYQEQIVGAGTKLEVIRVIAAVDRTYWRLYAARRVLEVRQQEYELAVAQLERAERMVEGGQMPEVEIVRAQAGVAERLEGIIVAENSLRDRQREFKRLINHDDLPVGSRTVVAATTEAEPVRYVLDEGRLLEAAMESRMELLQLEFQIAQDMSVVDYGKNQALPLVTADYTYNINGLGATRHDAYDMLYDNDFQDHRLGLQLVIPLGNEAAKSRVAQAIYQRNQRLVSKRDRESLIRFEVLSAIDQLETNWQRILATRQNTILAGRLFEAEKRQFEQGLRTSTDVLDAQTSLANAQTAEIQALVEYRIAQVDLAFATGMILGGAKVRWEEISNPSEAD